MASVFLNKRGFNPHPHPIIDEQFTFVVSFSLPSVVAVILLDFFKM